MAFYPVVHTVALGNGRRNASDVSVQTKTRRFILATKIVRSFIYDEGTL